MARKLQIETALADTTLRVHIVRLISLHKFPLPMLILASVYTSYWPRRYKCPVCNGQNEITCYKSNMSTCPVHYNEKINSQFSFLLSKANATDCYAVGHMYSCQKKLAE